MASDMERRFAFIANPVDTPARSHRAVALYHLGRVAERAAAGQTNRAIAEALFVTTKTVELHLRNAYRKLDVRSRLELAGALNPVPSAS